MQHLYSSGTQTVLVHGPKIKLIGRYRQLDQRETVQRNVILGQWSILALQCTSFSFIEQVDEHITIRLLLWRDRKNRP